MATLRTLGVRTFAPLTYPHKPGMARWLTEWVTEFAAAHARRGADGHPLPGARRGRLPRCGGRGRGPGGEGARAGRRVRSAGSAAPPGLGAARRGRGAGGGALRQRADPGTAHRARRVRRGARRAPRAAGGAGPRRACPTSPVRSTCCTASSTSGWTRRWSGTPFSERFAPLPADWPARLGRVADRVVFGSDFPNIPYAYAEQVRAVARWAAADGRLGAAFLRSVLHDAPARCSISDHCRRLWPGYSRRVNTWLIVAVVVAVVVIALLAVLAAPARAGRRRPTEQRDPAGAEQGPAGSARGAGRTRSQRPDQRSEPTPPGSSATTSRPSPVGAPPLASTAGSGPGGPHDPAAGARRRGRGAGSTRPNRPTSCRWSAGRRGAPGAGRRPNRTGTPAPTTTAARCRPTNGGGGRHRAGSRRAGRSRRPRTPSAPSRAVARSSRAARRSGAAARHRHQRTGRAAARSPARAAAVADAAGQCRAGGSRRCRSRTWALALASQSELPAPPAGPPNGPGPLPAPRAAGACPAPSCSAEATAAIPATERRRARRRATTDADGQSRNAGGPPARAATADLRPSRGRRMNSVRRGRYPVRTPAPGAEGVNGFDSGRRSR